MASYYGECDFSEHSSPSSNIFREDEESLLASYRIVSTSEFAFTGAEAFRRCCDKRERDLADGSSNCNEYILFTGVSVQDMTIVDRARRSMPKMYCQYDAREEVLIVKLMVGVAHENLTSGLSLIFTDKMRDLGLRNEIYCTGAATLGDGSRQKEADQSFKPLRTRPAMDAWPSLTFEVGFSESFAQLRNDARFWLTRSQLQSRIVLAVHIDKVQRQIDIERWEVINSQRPHHTTVQYSPTIGCVQRLVLREGGVYEGSPLELPVDKVFDIVPPNLAAGALDFTAPELQAWSDLFWQGCT